MRIHDRKDSRCHYRHGMSMEEIGKVMNISRERVRQIIEGAIKKIRRSPYRYLLSEFIALNRSTNHEDDFGCVGRYSITTKKC